MVRLERLLAEEIVPPSKLKTEQLRAFIKPKRNTVKIKKPAPQVRAPSCSISDLEDEETPLKFLKLDLHKNGKDSRNLISSFILPIQCIL